MICLALAGITFAAFWPARQNGFISLDDYQYIVHNPQIRSGLSWAGVGWAFASGYAANWHPLTWLSHMLDCQWFGLHPGGHHLVSVLLHCVNSVLLFVLLRKATGALWRSAIVAALFAWHPLHVESVAWAAERKDVLSGLFFMLTLWAYAEYAGKAESRKQKAETGEGRVEAQRAQRGMNTAGGRGDACGREPKGESEARRDDGTANIEHRTSNIEVGKLRGPCSSPLCWYLLALTLFALGLMSKPMLVTLPFVRLLVDFWPVGRLRLPSSGAPGAARFIPVGWRPLVAEKAPFFALALIASAVTWFVQKSGGAVMSAAELPLVARVGNALVAYVRYLAHACWPADLAAFYPYSRHLPLAWVAGALILLLLATAVAVLFSRREPYLAVGWFWFLGMLVPTIGLVQVGSQSMADRYMYLPGIGLSLALVWGGAALLARLPAARMVAPVLPAAALAACFLLTRAQVGFWKDSESLFRHATEVTAGNYMAYDSLGSALDQRGQTEEAIVCYEEAVRLSPSYLESRYNLGTALMGRGRPAEAAEQFEAALRIDPNYAPAHANLGKTLLDQGRSEPAAGHFLQAVRLTPNDPEAHFNLGTSLIALGHPAKAADCFNAALQLKPDYLEARNNLAVSLVRAGQPGLAVPHFARVAQARPAQAAAHLNLGLACLESGSFEPAAREFETVLKLSPDSAAPHYHLAVALNGLRRFDEAAVHARRACDLAAAEGDEALAARARELLAARSTVAGS